MRVLMTTCPGVGHVLPMLPLARAARDRGHEVVIAGGASLSEIIAAAGFRHELMGAATIREMFRGLPDVSNLPARERVLITMPKIFCEGLAPLMAEGVAELVGRWRPDVIVYEDMEFGAWVVAERDRIPHVTVQTTAWRPHIRALARQALRSLREQYGLVADEGSDPALGELFLTTRPVSLRDPAAPLPDVTAELQPIADDRGADDDATAADPFPPRDGRPRIAITLGTVNHDQVGILHALIDGAVGAGTHVVVALGTDPATLGPVPDGVDVHAYIPMSTLLPAADVVAYHGGSGTMLAALAAGIPMLIVPLAADQPDNGDRCEAAGVARILEPDDVDASTVRTAIEAILDDSAYQSRAGQLAAEIAAMPSPNDAMERIESVVARAST